VGFARIVSRLRPRARVAACAATLAIILLEGTGGAMPLAFLSPHGRPDRAAYAWVRDGGAGAVLELPAGELDTTFRTYQYEYQTLFHHRPIVNGASGYNSALQVFLGSSASPLVEAGYFPDGLRALRQAGVGTVVVHTQAFADGATGASVVELFKQEMATGAGTSQVVSEATFPGIVVYRLAEWREAPAPAGDMRSTAGQAIPPSSFVVTSSHAGDRLERAFDGNIETRWVSGERQSGTEWIDVAFDRPHDVARVRILTADRSLGDYPRELVIESVDGAGPPVTLYRGTIVQPLVQGLVADPLHGPIDIPLPAHRSSRLRLRQIGQTRIWFWAVDELQLFER